MKWLIVSSVAAISIAVGPSTPTLADIGGGRQFARDVTTQLADNDRRDGDQRGRGRQQPDSRRDQPPRQGPQRYDWKTYQPRQPPPNEQQYGRYNRRDWERTYDAPRRYRVPPYRRQSGWYYRQWLYGSDLPTRFWARDYWIDDYWQYGLIDPPYGCIWVRYYGDALLIDVETGRILQVVYGLFYN